MKYGYARVGPDKPDLAAQLAALDAAGCETVFQDEGTEAGTACPALERCLEVLGKGDTLVVWRLDRLGRRLRGLAAMLDDLEQRGIRFISLDEAIDTGTRTGRVVRRTIGALAALEHAETAARIRAGIQAARERGSRVDGGRGGKVTPEQLVQARGLFEGERMSLAETARVLGIAATTLRTALERAGVQVKRGRTQKVPPEMLDRARDLLEKGMNGVEIADAVGVTPSDLRIALRRAGVQLRQGKRRKLTPEMLVRARERIEQGEGKGKVARSMGVSREALRVAFLRDRIKVRSHRPRARAPKMTPEMLARARELIEQGDSKAEAGRKIGVGDTSLRFALRRAGVEYQRTRPSMTAARLARARKLLEQGKTQAEVARTIGVGKSTLSRILQIEKAQQNIRPPARKQNRRQRGAPKG